MKKNINILILVLAMVNLFIISGYAGDKDKGKSKYMVVVSHTPEQCLVQLDQISTQGADMLNKFEWGCKSGDHTGYALIHADNEASVRKMYALENQENVKIVKVDQFTQEDLESIHKKMK